MRSIYPTSTYRPFLVASPPHGGLLPHAHAPPRCSTNPTTPDDVRRLDGFTIAKRSLSRCSGHHSFTASCCIYVTPLLLQCCNICCNCSHCSTPSSFLDCWTTETASESHIPPTQRLLSCPKLACTTSCSVCPLLPAMCSKHGATPMARHSSCSMGYFSGPLISSTPHACPPTFKP